MSLRLTDITKSFGKNTVIENFSLFLENGSRTALISPSGSGKTTLFRIIAGLERRFEGKREVDGKIALMFQEDRLFDSVTVLENVTSVTDMPVEDVKSVLADLGLGDSLKLYPRELSGGMKRRVALARALVYGGDVVLLDECFTGLDSDTRRSVADTVNKYTEGKLVVLITHDREEAELLNCKVLSFENFRTKACDG